MSTMDGLILFGPMLVMVLGAALAMGLYFYFCERDGIDS